ncbi:NADP-dependent isocitrate dehydrogenase, partial [Streptomyces albidoflavus]
MTDSTIFYTHTDEAPALATYSFLPVVEGVAAPAGGTVVGRVIKLGGGGIARITQR